MAALSYSLLFVASSLLFLLNSSGQRVGLEDGFSKLAKLDFGFRIILQSFKNILFDFI
jgi:hypothetical protein